MYPWNWTAAHLDDWSADLVSVAGKAKSTIRSYHDAVRSFESYLIAPQYRWAEECQARFGVCTTIWGATGLVVSGGHPRL